MREVEEFGLKVFKIECAVVFAIISSSSPQNLSLYVQNCLQLFLNALQTVFVILIFFTNLKIVLLHGFRNYLIVFVLSIHHDNSWTIGLQLLHDLKTVSEPRFILSFIDFVL